MTRAAFLAQLEALDAAEQAVLDYFGYKHDWRIFPIVREDDRYWCMRGRHEVVTSPTEQSVRRYVQSDGCDLADDIYTSEIYNAHLPRHVWRGEDFTMALVDTRCDGNIWLAIYQNDHEVTP